ncbi:hypothetical protein JNM87_00265 [Candidatus Saccharibacteria bacterium]|nr:hypothetical protein [Candidatus Saccharibacteria bacterium]
MMTSRPENTSPELGIEQHPSIDSGDALSATNAQLVRDTLLVLNHPAYTSVAAYDMDAGNRIYPSVLNLYLAQIGIGYMLSNHIRGVPIPPVGVQEAHDRFAGVHGLTSQLRATNELHGMITGLANHFGVPVAELGKQARGKDAGKLILPLAQDFLTYCQRGLIGPDGESTQFQFAASRLRALNFFTSFSNDALDPSFAEGYASRLMRPMTEGHQAVEDQAQELAEYYSSGRATQAVMSRFNSRNQRGLVPVYNRAAQLLLASTAAGEVSHIPENPTATRRIGREVIAAAAASDLEEVSKSAVRLLRQLEDNRTQLEASESESIEQEITIAQQLDWEVLPPGEVRAIATEIVENAYKGKAIPSVDLERLNILKNIRERWGDADDSYYARGVRKKRKLVTDVETGEKEADQYLILVLRERNELGEIIAEHAVAESPITKLNAMAVFRQDVSEGLTWKEVMSLPKSYAYALGARAVKHTVPRTNVPENYLTDSMTKKAMALLAAPKDVFDRIIFDGDREPRIRPKS